MSLDWFSDVLDFHKKLVRQIIRPLPAVPPMRNKEDYCLGFINEERDELEAAMMQGSVAKVADALADLIYVVIRAALIWGIDLRPVWDEVHTANMRKEGGHTRADNKILKPAGWVGPDVAGVLMRQKPIEGGLDRA